MFKDILKKQAWPWVGEFEKEMGSMELQNDNLNKDVNSQSNYDSLVTEKSVVDGQQSSVTYEDGMLSPIEDVSYAKDIKNRPEKKAFLEILSDGNFLASFSCGLAKTFQEKTSGLQVYDTLDENAGLLFEYTKPEDVIYHMGTVKFPIDIIFVDDNNKIKKIYKNIQPGTLGTFGCSKTKYVLEICGGLSDRLEVVTGNDVSVKFKESIIQDEINKISKNYGIQKDIIVKKSMFGKNQIQNWNGFPILNMGDDINKFASDRSLISDMVVKFKPKPLKLAIFNFDNLIEKDPYVNVYSCKKIGAEDELIHLTTTGTLVRANLNAFKVVHISDINEVENDCEAILPIKSLSSLMMSSFDEFSNMYYKMKSKSKDYKLIIATSFPNIRVIENLLYNKIKTHLGEDISFDVMKISDNADFYNIIDDAKNKFKVGTIELYGDSTILKKAGIPVSDDVKQKARRVYKLLDSASEIIETSLENMKKNVSEYEKIKDDVDAIKRTKGLYNQSIKRNTIIIRDFLIKIRDAIKILNEIKDVSTTIEIINGITSTTKIISDSIEGIFNLIDELENSDFFINLSEKVKEFEKNVEDVHYSIKRGINYVNTDILGLIILSD